MEKSSVDKGQLLFKKFIKLLKSEFIQSLDLHDKKIEEEKKNPSQSIYPVIGKKSEWRSWETLKLESEFDDWCKNYVYNQTKVFICAKTLLLRSKYDPESKYQFVKYVSEKGYCVKLEDDNLLTPELIPFIDQEYLSTLVGRSRNSEIGHILSYTKDMNVFKKVISNFKYFINDGVYPRSIVPNIILPNNINYSKEVSQNTTIDIYNMIYDDACVREKWPAKIRGLVYDKSANSPKTIVYLNQDNIISLAKSLYSWGPGIGDFTYERAEEFYKVIRERISKGTLTIYDYQSNTLANMKLKLKTGVDFKSAAPYTRYVLDRFIDHGYDDDKLDKRLKRIIRYNPTNIRKVL